MLFRISQGGTITRQALGRIAQLGDLYDAHTDCFCGRALFSSDLPESSIKLTDTQGTICEYIIQGSINDKFNKLDVEAELKKLEAELAYQEGFLQSVRKKLGNERFVQNAKPEIVENERKKLADAESKIELLKENIKALRN